MLEQDAREMGEQILQEAGPPDPHSAREQSNADGAGADHTVRLRAPPRQDQLLPHRPDPHIRARVDVPVEESDRQEKGWFGRHPIAVALISLSSVLAVPAGYLYWDYTSHFESTDDAYIASRQFAIAPEVSGYITAVPVTDNEHVATGQIIARIDDRTYRAALAQAVAQVAPREPASTMSMRR